MNESKNKSSVEVYSVYIEELNEILTADELGYHLIKRNLMGYNPIISNTNKLLFPLSKYIHLISLPMVNDEYSHFYLLSRSEYVKYKNGDSSILVDKVEYAACFTWRQLFQVRLGMKDYWFQKQTIWPWIITSLISATALLLA